MKTMGRLRALPRATWMLFGAGAVAAVAAAALTLTPGGEPVGVADAHKVPSGCDAGVGASSAQIDAPGTIPPVVEGQLINYRLRVGYPTDGNQDLCQAFNVDVWIKLPGAASYQLACNMPVINEGETLQCPDLVPYTAEGADRTAGVLQAFLFAIGDKHDQVEDDCITTPDNPDTGVGPICFGIQVTSNIGMPNTPTPTPTNTPTSTPTNTPTNTPVTPSVTPNPSHTPEKNTPVKHSSPTRTPAPSTTPSPVNTTLPATVAPQPTNTPPPVGVTLPPAGGGGGPMGDLSLPVAGLALMALVLAGAGIVVAKRQGI